MHRIKTDDERRASLPVLPRERLRPPALVLNVTDTRCRCVVVPVFGPAPGRRVSW